LATASRIETQCLGCLLFSFALELLAANYTLSLTRGMALEAAGFGFLMPFAGLCFGVWCVEEKSWIKRLLMAASTGLGYAVGTVAVLAYYR
jgi:hypothetical protein